MILRPYSFNGTSILTGTSTDYEASVPRSSANLQMQTSAQYTRRAGAVPVYSGKDFQPYSLVLEIEAIHDFMTVFESLNTLFDTKDETPRQLIMQDTEDSDKQYYVYATPTQVQGGHDGPMAVVTLAVDDPIWQSVTQNSQTFSTTASTGSANVVNAGNDYAYPIFEVTAATQPTTDYPHSTYLQVLPTSALGWANRFLDITGSSDTTYDTAALVAAGEMQADGDDLRVFQNGTEIDRWLNGINTTDTHVIIRATLPPARNMTLKTALASTDTITEIELLYTTANKTTISLCPDVGRLIVDAGLSSTDTEEFTYTARTITDTKLAFTISARGVRGTVALSFAAAANVRFLPHDFSIVHGLATATAPVTDDTRKPLPALTSRNNSFTFTNFADNANLRPNGWTKSKVTSSALLARSGQYNSTGGGDTDPATAIGLRGMTFESGGIWRSDTVTMAWTGYFPDTVSSLTASGQQLQNSASWPTVGFYAGDGITTSNLWTIAAQATTDYNTYTAWSKATTDYTAIPANTKYLQFLMTGTILGSTDVSALAEADTVAVGLTNYPHITIRDKSTINKLDFTLTNATTGESIRIVHPTLVGGTLIIDTDPDFPTAKLDGQIVNGAVTLSTVRAAWLKLNPGTNVINFDNNLAAVSDISTAIKWRDRMSFM